MKKEEAVEALRLAIKTKHEANIPNNATERMRDIALATGDLISRMTADSFEYNFDIYESIFTDYLTSQWDASKVKAPDNKE